MVEPAESPAERSGPTGVPAGPVSAPTGGPGAVSATAEALSARDLAAIRRRFREVEYLAQQPADSKVLRVSQHTMAQAASARDVPVLLAEVDRLGVEVDEAERNYTRVAVALAAAQPVLDAAGEWRDRALQGGARPVWKAVQALKDAVETWRASATQPLPAEPRVRVSSDEAVTRAELDEVIAENGRLHGQVREANRRVREAVAERDEAVAHSGESARRAATDHADLVRVNAVLTEARDNLRQYVDLPDATLVEAIEQLRQERDTARVDHGRLFAELGQMGNVMRTPERFTAPKPGWYRISGHLPGTGAGWRPEYAAEPAPPPEPEPAAEPTYAHDPGCNTLHFGAAPCPLPREPAAEDSLFHRTLIDQAEHPEGWPRWGDPASTAMIRDTDHGDIIAMSNERIAAAFATAGLAIGEPERDSKGWDWIRADWAKDSARTAYEYPARVWRTEAEKNAAAYATMVTQHDDKARTVAALGHQYLDALGRLQAIHDMVTITVPHLHEHDNAGHITAALRNIHKLSGGQARDDGTVREIVAQWRQLDADEPQRDLDHDWRQAKQWLTDLATQHGWNIIR